MNPSGRITLEHLKTALANSVQSAQRSISKPGPTTAPGYKCRIFKGWAILCCKPKGRRVIIKKLIVNSAEKRTKLRRTATLAMWGINTPTPTDKRTSNHRLGSLIWQSSC